MTKRRSRALGCTVALLGAVGLCAFEYYKFDREYSLIWRARIGDAARVQGFLREGVDANASFKGLSALDWAVYGKHEEVALLLIRSGALDRKALRRAITRNDLPVAAELIRRGVTPYYGYGGNLQKMDRDYGDNLLSRTYTVLATELRNSESRVVQQAHPPSTRTQTQRSKSAPIHKR